MRSDDLDFDLPPHFIAQEPAANRADARLLHYSRADRSIAHRKFVDLPAILRRGDLLVLNDARVIPARFGLSKATGGFVEALFLKQLAPRRWQVMLRNFGKSGAGTLLRFVDDPGIEARVIEQHPGGEYQIEVHSDQPAMDVLQRLGRMPLPPYIKRAKQHDERDPADRQRYQTVFALTPGAVAAPTAGLHFTNEIFNSLKQHGVDRCFVTLHVGMGTFKPITAERLDQHVMHSENYSIPEEAATKLNAARDEGRRIIAVGTTCARVLESQPRDRPFKAKTEATDIFIYPPYEWQHISALITNFHLPRSTLIALVAAMVGLDEQRRIYRVAISERYRFFSFGDATFIE